MSEGNGSCMQVQLANTPNAYGISTPQELQQKIDAAIPPLLDMNFTESTYFTVTAVNNRGFTVDGFIKLIKPLTSIKNEAEFKAIIALGFRRFWNSQTNSITLQQLIAFCKWLKSDEGRKKVADIAAKRKLQKKSASATFTPEDEAKVAKWRRKIKSLERERDAKLEALKEKFVPCSYYVPLAADEVALLAYDLYIAEAVRQGKAASPCNDAGLKIAVKMFGKQVNDRHKVEFINSGSNSQMLDDFCREMVLHMESIGNVRQANKFRNLLVVARGEKAMDEAPEFTFGIAPPQDISGEEEGRAEPSSSRKKKRSSTSAH